MPDPQWLVEQAARDRTYLASLPLIQQPQWYRKTYGEIDYLNALYELEIETND